MQQNIMFLLLIDQCPHLIVNRLVTCFRLHKKYQEGCLLKMYVITKWIYTKCMILFSVCPARAPPKIGKNMIFWRKIGANFLSAPPLT
jgi:hypothetical protein